MDEEAGLAKIEARSTQPTTDRRSKRTRAAIFDAFAVMVLRDGFDTITPSTLAAAANVGRSTFYAHFANVDEVLAASMARLLAPLAASAMRTEMDPQAIAVVQHFWDNRRMARRMLAGRGHAVVVRLFTDQLEIAMTDLQKQRQVSQPLAPPRLAATYLASGALALLEVWLAGQASGSAAQIASALHAATNAAASAFSLEP
jgi:AcrR family transcriptional regulator